MSNLDREIATYNRHLPELLGQQGKFVLIKGTEIAGTFDSYQDALTAGYQRFKLALFLVKQITPSERNAYFSRDLNTSWADANCSIYSRGGTQPARCGATHPRTVREQSGSIAGASARKAEGREAIRRRSGLDATQATFA